PLQKIRQGRHGMPGEPSPAGMFKSPRQGAPTRLRQFRAVQRHVEHDVGIEKCLHRTCLAMMASTRSSLRLAGSTLNAPCQRWKKASLSRPSADASRSKCSSTKVESGTPRRRATAFARCTDLAPMESVSLVFIRMNLFYTYDKSSACVPHATREGRGLTPSRRGLNGRAGSPLPAASESSPRNTQILNLRLNAKAMKPRASCSWFSGF